MIRFEALPTTEVRSAQGGGPDAYGHAAEQATSDGDGVPCRHCLKPVGAGERYLILAWRPFRTINPYTETGPIFLHADPCERAVPSADLPAILVSPDYIVRGYSAEERIVYGTGRVTPRDEIASYAATLLDRPEIAFVDIRSARNNCFQCRIVRSG